MDKELVVTALRASAGCGGTFRSSAYHYRPTTQAPEARRNKARSAAPAQLRENHSQKIESPERATEPWRSRWTCLDPPPAQPFRHPDGVHEFSCVANPELRFAALRALLRRASGALKGELACFRKNVPTRHAFSARPCARRSQRGGSGAAARSPSALRECCREPSAEPR